MSNTGAVITFFLASFLLQQLEAEPIVIGESYQLESKILQQAHEINVYLPQTYDAKDDAGKAMNQAYPVVYLIDGGIEQDFIHIAGLASLAVDYRNIREFILVGVQTVNRRYELTSPTQVAEEIKHVPKNGGSQKFMDFLAKEVKPFVAENLRITDESMVIGESVAGMFIVEVFLTRPELFSNYAAISPSLWWNNQAIAKASATELKKHQYQGKRLYLTIADEGGDMREGVDILADAVEKAELKDFQWKYEPMEHKTHATIFHPAALEAIHFLMAIKPFADYQKEQQQ
ncbi:MAG: alpha/beta hydrolase [Gammaproteobacteria bacterium]|nr:alpha/beta hydrolase [Gammaproteobacteria bacterium]